MKNILGKWFAISLFFLLAPMAVWAQLATEYRNWAEGPAKWIMTREETRAWQNVKTNPQAEEFIDLFWARRDPTPGTPANEFKDEFESRVAWADANYQTRKSPTRGAMTDMGRVYIALGKPREADTHIGGGESAYVEGRAISQLGGRRLFTYERPAEVGLNGPVQFVENVRGEYKIDTQKGGTMGALAAAPQRTIVNPGLTSVPDWAMRGTARPKQNVTVETRVVERSVPAAAIIIGEPGATLFTLTKDAQGISPQTGKNPLADLTSVTTFTKQDELGYAFEYCTSGSTNEPALTVAVTITGLIGGERINMRAPADEVNPENIRNMPGCYLVRGSVPMADMAAGDYKIMLDVQDATAGQKYNLTHDFKVE